MEQKSLISMVRELTEIERQLVENEGQLSPEIEQLFDLTLGDIKDKADRYKWVCDALEARAVFFKERADEMTRARKLFENQKDRLKANLKFSMQSMGTTEIEGFDFRWKLSPMKDKVVINEEELPEEYKKDHVTRVPDRDAIERGLMLGENIPGVTVEAVVQLRNYINKSGRATPVKEIKNGN